MRAAAALRARARPPALPAPPARPPRAPAPARCRSLSALQRLVLQMLVMKLVAELVTFRGEIANVLGGRRGFDGHLFDHLEPEPFDAGDLLRVVREDADRRQAEVGEDLIADPVVAHVGLEPELEVRFDRVEPVLLQLVRAQLVQQSDPAALLRHVQKNTTLLGRDLRQRLLELLAAVAAQRVEHVAGEALGMDAHEHVLGCGEDDPAVKPPSAVGSCTVVMRSTSRSWPRRYSIRSATVTSFSPCRSQYGIRSGTRAIVPSSFMISHTTPAGISPANRARSTAASVCPARTSTPPSRARSGKTRPGWTRSAGLDDGSIATWIVRERSGAEIPVVTPSRASTEIVNAVP